jgi:sn-glycerol 3-phosphate transport system ATP-binding protein
MTLADRLIIMNAGRVEQIGRPSDVYHNPASRFVADFIGSPAMNLIEGEFDAKGMFNHGAGGQLRIETGMALAGRKVALGVRPEAIRRAAAGSNGAIAAVVDYVEELGASRLIDVDANGSRLIVMDASTGALPSGIKLHFTFAEQDVHLFAEDGRRIETHASAARMAAHAAQPVNA